MVVLNIGYIHVQEIPLYIPQIAIFMGCNVGT